MLRIKVWAFILLFPAVNLLFGQAAQESSEAKNGTLNLKSDFIQLNKNIQSWWDKDIHSAKEKDILASKGAYGLEYLPFPYVSGGGSEAFFQEMYGWDTYFINRALLVHGRNDLVKNHILNHLFMIERYGYVVNGNNTGLITRAQPPLLPSSIMKYFEATKDTSLLYFAFPLLEQEYNNYWNAPHHTTPIGLTTCKDLGDKGLRPELASEAETGLDFCACFDGKVTECVPLNINCTLVKYEEALSAIAGILNLSSKESMYKAKATERIEKIRKYCWNEKDGFFYEYNYVKNEQTKVKSLCAYWTIWAGVATKEQSKKLVENLKYFEHQYGLSFTSENYASPHPEFTWLQWGFPVAWAPMHVVTLEALRIIGEDKTANRIADKYLSMVVGIYNKTGKLWEKYNALDGTLNFPTERYGNPAMHGWTSAAVVLIGADRFLR
jgi:alpha,alpha-trehalase